MKTSPRLIFFGTEAFSAAALDSLISSDYELAAVVTKPDAPAGRGQTLQSPAVKTLAEAAGLKILQPSKPADIVAELQALRPTHGVLSAYGLIVPPAILDIFAGGIINIHPSLLPKYRGPSPIETAILNGDKQTGISLMRLSSGLDAGPIYAQKTVEIPAGARSSEFVPPMAAAGAQFLMEKLPDVLAGRLQQKAQDDSQATYTKLFKKEDGQLDLKQPAERLERQVRAFDRWPRSRLELFDNQVIVTRIRLAKDEKDGGLVVKASPGWLEIVELIAPSGRRMSGADFIRGYRRD